MSRYRSSRFHDNEYQADRGWRSGGRKRANFLFDEGSFLDKKAASQPRNTIHHCGPVSHHGSGKAGNSWSWKKPVSQKTCDFELNKEVLYISFNFFVFCLCVRECTVHNTDSANIVSHVQRGQHSDDCSFGVAFLQLLQKIFCKVIWNFVFPNWDLGIGRLVSTWCLWWSSLVLVYVYKGMSMMSQQSSCWL